MYIVTYGSLEVYTYFEGNEFVIERLNQGSIVNSRLIFIDDVMRVNIRTTPNTHIAEFNAEALDDLMCSNKKFERKLLLY